MSSESENPEDDLIFDDDDFLLDEPSDEQDKFIFEEEGEDAGEGAGDPLDTGEFSGVFNEDADVGEPAETGDIGGGFDEPVDAGGHADPFDISGVFSGLENAGEPIDTGDVSGVHSERGDAGEADDTSELFSENEDASELLGTGDIAGVFNESRQAPTASSEYSEGEDDTLFTDHSVEDASEQFDSERNFTEERGAHWGGDELTAEQVGIPTGGELELPHAEIDPLASDSDQVFDLEMEEQELELVEHESELDAATVEHEDTEFVLHEADPGIAEDQGDQEFVLQDQEDTEFVLQDQEDAEFVLQDQEDAEFVLQDEEEVDPEWAPVASRDSDVGEEDSFVVEGLEDSIYAPEAPAHAAHEEHGEYAEGEPDFAEYEESYVESQQAYEEAGHQPRRRFRLVSMFSGLAAAGLLIAAGTVVVLKPELFGLRVEPDLVDRAEIARPRIDLTVTPPELELPPEPVPVPVNPVPVPVPVNPVPVPVPVPVNPVPVPPVNPVPINPVPINPTPPPPVVATPQPEMGPEHGPIQIGSSGLAIGAEEEMIASGTEHPLTIGVTAGSQAFAQLKNGNFFIGRVKKVSAPFDITLDIQIGEVTLALDDLQTLTSLGSDEYLELQRAEKGFVRLTNNNLLRGTILKYGGDDNVILEVRANRILIPRDVVEEVGNAPDASVHLDESGDEDWVRRLVEEEMARDTGPIRVEDTEKQGRLKTAPLINR